MQRGQIFKVWNFRRIAAVLAITLFALSGATGMIPTVKASSGTVVIGGPAASTATSQLIGPLSQDQTIAASVGFLTNRPLLDQLLQALYNPSSPMYRQFLTSDQFSNLFAPSPSDYATAVNYFSSLGIQTYTDQSRLFVNLDGTVSQFDNAFSTTIDLFNNQNLGNFYANVNPLSLPATFGSSVTTAVGLENYTYYVPLSSSIPAPPGCTPAVGSVQTPCMTVPNPTECGTPIPYGSVESSLWLIPEQVQGAYNETGLICSGHNGSGQTVVLIDAGYGDRTIQTDIAEFSTEFGLPIPVVSMATVNATNTVLDVTGQFTCNQIGNTTCITSQVPVADVQNAAPVVGWDGETALDVEWAHATAPGANLVSMTSFDAGAGLDEAIATAIAGHYGNIISQSFGQCECVSNNTYPGGPVTGGDAVYTDPFYRMAAATGITVLASSGDWGSNSTPNGSTCVTAPEWPAADPYLTGVGGTVLNVAGTTWSSEGAWGGYSCLANQGGSGGGYSIGRRPSYQYETNLYPNGAGVSQNQLLNPQLVGSAPVWPPGVNPSTFSTDRAVPDVAAVGGSGVWIYCNECATQSPVFGTAGTSLASPAYAGMIAVMESALNNTQYSTFGLFNQVAYQILNSPSYNTVTHQITSFFTSSVGNGNSQGPPQEYQPGPGWNPVTGIGTPNVGLIVECLQGTFGLNCNPGPQTSTSGISITQPSGQYVTVNPLTVMGTDDLGPGNFQTGQPNTAIGVGGQQANSLDILQAWFSNYRTLASGQKAFNVNLRVQNLTNIMTPATGALGEHWEITWSYGGVTNYAEMLLWYQSFVSVSNGATGLTGLFFYAGNITTGTAGTTVSHNVVNGTYTAAAPGMITITVPTADVSNPVLGSTFAGASADAQQFIGTTALWFQFKVSQTLDPPSFPYALGNPLLASGTVQIAAVSGIASTPPASGTPAWTTATLVNFPASNSWTGSVTLGSPGLYTLFAQEVSGTTTQTTSEIISYSTCITTGNLEHASLAGCNLTGMNFAGANLRYANFAGAIVSGANFQGANLQYANFDGSTLTGLSASQPTNFNNANMRHASLFNAVCGTPNYISASGTNLPPSYAVPAACKPPL
jgi:hypothetical protein